MTTPFGWVGCRFLPQPLRQAHGDRHDKLPTTHSVSRWATELAPSKYDGAHIERVMQHVLSTTLA